MDGPFYLDLREPHFASDLAAVTLATTDKALHTAAAMPPAQANYFARATKKWKIEAFGKITTAATPGNLTFDVYFGSGADANGTIIASSAALTLIANQTNISWKLELTIRCTTPGASGALEVTGSLMIGTAVVAAGMALIPASAAAPVTVDLTTSNIISIQAKRSGSTAETMTVQELSVLPYN